MMKKILCLALTSLFVAAVHGFQPGKEEPQRRKIFHRTPDDQSTTDHRWTPEAQPKRKGVVYTNEHYVPPVTPATPVHSTRTQRSKQPLEGGQHFLEMSQSIRLVKDHTINGILMRQAGDAVKDIGVAWQAGDWEAVTYAALDASQTMEYIAKDLNKERRFDGDNNNKLQQAYAGIAVELRELSKCQRPKAINLQGLSLRLHQAAASQSTSADNHRQLEDASRAARSLAKLYGATSTFLPRRFQLWWHDRNSKNNAANSEVESEWE